MRYSALNARWRREMKASGPTTPIAIAMAMMMSRLAKCAPGNRQIQRHIADDRQADHRRHAPEHVKIDGITAEISGAHQVHPQLAAQRIVDAETPFAKMPCNKTRDIAADLEVCSRSMMDRQPLTQLERPQIILTAANAMPPIAQNAMTATNNGVQSPIVLVSEIYHAIHDDVANQQHQQSDIDRRLHDRI